MKVKSPLRYPGGKSRATKMIIPLFPKDIKEYREPMVGGGSIYLAIRQLLGDDVRYWINDMNRGVYSFWEVLRKNPSNLIKILEFIQGYYQDVDSGRTMYETLKDTSYESEFMEAVRFFIINRCGFSGVESGGFSKQAFLKRFTASSVSRLRPVHPLLQNSQITHGDYSGSLSQAGDGVFIFLDPPYSNTNQSRLYGKNGRLHSEFDHERFAELTRVCTNHRWLITCDDSPLIRDLFSFAYIREWKLQYSMTNVASKTTRAGDELFISNYPLP